MSTEDRFITKVKSQIDSWRANKPKAGSHMPKQLWTAAGQLAKQHGVRVIAKRLALHPTRLKMHAGIENLQAEGKALDRVSKAAARQGGSLSVVEVAPIHISAGELSRGSLLSQNPTAVLSTPQGVSLSFYQVLDAQTLAALVRAAVEGVGCSK